MGFVVKKRQCKYSAYYVCFLIVLMISGTAWSYDGQDVSRETHSFVPIPKVKSDYCTSYMKSLHMLPLSAEPSVERQRNVGKIAALGMIFGARYALEPSKFSVIPKDFKPVNPAQIIVAYRQCKKNKSLRTVLLEQ